MLNAEKYKEELLECAGKYNSSQFSISKDHSPRFKTCSTTLCSDCMLSKQEGYCSTKRIKWLLSEYREPIKLTKLEYDILKYLADNTRCMYIARGKSGNLFIFDIEPVKNNINTQWNGRGMKGMLMFNKLFQFVKWEDKEPTSIKDVLDNCEVVEDE